MSARPDLVFLNYPNAFVYYSFIARLASLLNSQDSSTHPMPYMQQQINRIAQQFVSRELLSAKAEGEFGVYWSSILGNYANVRRNEDALSSTALAVNALINIWTVQKGSQLAYHPSTPTEVKQAIHLGVSSLEHGYKNNWRKDCMFFADPLSYGPDRGRFPSNHNEEYVAGFIEPAEYESMSPLK